MALEHAKKPAITGRPADLLKPEWEQLRTGALALAGCNGSDEDVLTYAMFPQVAPKFFKSRTTARRTSAAIRQRKPRPPRGQAASQWKANAGSASQLCHHAQWQGTSRNGRARRCSQELRCRIRSNEGYFSGYVPFLFAWVLQPTVTTLVPWCCVTGFFPPMLTGSGDLTSPKISTFIPFMIWRRRSEPASSNPSSNS